MKAVFVALFVVGTSVIASAEPVGPRVYATGKVKAESVKKAFEDAENLCILAYQNGLEKLTLECNRKGYADHIWEAYGECRVNRITKNVYIKVEGTCSN